MTTILTGPGIRDWDRLTPEQRSWYSLGDDYARKAGLLK